MPSEKEMPRLYRTLSDMATQSGMNVALFQPKPPVEGFGFSEVPITVTAETGYHQLGSFFDRVGKLGNGNLEVHTAAGHADRSGSDAYNMKLSVRRADAVKAYLVSKGIAASRVYTEGKGERQPVKDCKGDKVTKELIACLQPNRRADIEAVGSVTK